jgi:release factor glutamine methyltransferase
VGAERCRAQAGPISLRSAYLHARDRLQAAEIDEAPIEAEVLLRHALSTGGIEVTRAELFKGFEEPLEAALLAGLEALVERRLAHEPSAYITGHREFYGLDLLVTPDVLIPRPETETLVEAVLSLAETSTPQRLTVVDVGTGSGAIAVALASALRRAEVYATDVSLSAPRVAESNAHRPAVERRVRFLHGDLLLPLRTYVDFVVANLPYVTTGDWQALPKELHDHEPRLALDGGDGGLSVIRALLHQAPRYLRPGGSVLLEFGDGQAAAVLQLAHASLPAASCRIMNDLGGRPRVLVAMLQ